MSLQNEDEQETPSSSVQSPDNGEVYVTQLNRVFSYLANRLISFCQYLFSFF